MAHCQQPVTKEEDEYNSDFCEYESEENGVQVEACKTEDEEEDQDVVTQTFGQQQEQPMRRGQDQRIEQEEVDIQKLIMMCNEALKEGKPERGQNEWKQQEVKQKDLSQREEVRSTANEYPSKQNIEAYNPMNSTQRTDRSKRGQAIQDLVKEVSNIIDDLDTLDVSLIEQIASKRQTPKK